MTPKRYAYVNYTGIPYIVSNGVRLDRQNFDLPNEYSKNRSVIRTNQKNDPYNTIWNIQRNNMRND